MGWQDALAGLARGLTNSNDPLQGGSFPGGYDPFGNQPGFGQPQFASGLSIAGPGIPGQLNDYAMTGGEEAGGDGLGGWWGGLDGMEKAQIIASALSAGAGIYGQHQAGKAQDREFDENQRRYEEAERRRREDEARRAAGLRAFLPTTYNPGYEG